MKKTLLATACVTAIAGLWATSTGAVSNGETWSANGSTVQMIKGVLNAHCPGCSTDDVVAGTSDGGLIGGFIAVGPSGEERLVFCSDALTPSTLIGGPTQQANVDGKLQYLLWKYNDLSGQPETTGAAMQALVWMMRSDAAGRSSVWSANGTAFTPSDWDTKEVWATDNRIGFHMVDPEFPIYSIVTDGAEATLITEAQDFGHAHTIVVDDTVTVAGSTSNDAADLTVVTVAAATDPTYAVTDATRDGTTATATLGTLSAGSGAYTFQVGDSVTIAGSTEFNGTHTLTAVAGDGTTISWADTGAATDESGISATADVDPGWDSVITFASTVGAGTDTPADATLTVQGAHGALVTALDARTRSLYLEGASNAAPWSLNADANGVTLLSASDNPIEGHTITVTAPGEDPVDLTTDSDGTVVWPEAWGEPGYSTTWSASAVAPGTVWEIVPTNQKQEMLITGEDGSVSGSYTSDPAPTTTTEAPPTTTTIAPPATTSTTTSTTTTTAPPPTFPSTGVSTTQAASSLALTLTSLFVGLLAAATVVVARRRS